MPSIPSDISLAFSWKNGWINLCLIKMYLQLCVSGWQKEKDSNSSNLYFENTLISGSWEYFDFQYKTYFNQAALKMLPFVNNCSVGLGLSFHCLFQWWYLHKNHRDTLKRASLISGWPKGDSWLPKEKSFNFLSSTRVSGSCLQVGLLTRLEAGIFNFKAV